MEFIKENLSEYKFEERDNELILKQTNEHKIDAMGRIVVRLSPPKANSWIDVEIRHMKSGKTREILKIAVKLAKEIDTKLVETLEIRSIVERISTHFSGLNISFGNISLGFVGKEKRG